MKPLKALNKNTILLLIGQLISQLGDKVISLGLSWMFVKNHLEHHLPWYLLVCVLPSLLLVGDIGPRVSRIGYLRTVVWTDLARALLFLIVALLVWWLPSQPTNNIYLLVIYTMGFINGFLGAYFAAGVTSLPTQIAKDETLEALNGLMNSFSAGAGILGLALGALLYEWVGLAGVMLINGLSFLIAVIFSLKIRIANSDDAKPEKAEVIHPIDSDRVGLVERESRDMHADQILAKSATLEKTAGRSSFEIFMQESFIRTLLLSFFSFNFFATPLMVYVPIYAERVFSAGARGVSILEVSLSLGLIFGGLGVGFFSLQRFRLSRVIFILYVLFAFNFLGFGFAKNLWVGSAVLFVVGCVVAWLNVQFLTFFQKQASAQDLASVMTAVNVVSQASLPLSFIVLGFLLPLASPKAVFMLSAFGMTLVALVTAYFVSFFENRENRTRPTISTEGTLC